MVGVWVIFMVWGLNGGMYSGLGQVVMIMIPLFRVNFYGLGWRGEMTGPDVHWHFSGCI